MDIKELKKELDKLETAAYKLGRAKNAIERKDANREIDNSIFLLNRFELHEHDPGIEIKNFGLSRVNHLIYDIKNIITKLEKDEN